MKLSRDWVVIFFFITCQVLEPVMADLISCSSTYYRCLLHHGSPAGIPSTGIPTTTLSIFPVHTWENGPQYAANPSIRIATFADRYTILAVGDDWEQVHKAGLN